MHGLISCRIFQGSKDERQPGEGHSRGDGRSGLMMNILEKQVQVKNQMKSIKRVMKLLTHPVNDNFGTYGNFDVM